MGRPVCGPYDNGGGGRTPAATRKEADGTAYFGSNFLDELSARADIADVVSRYVRLEPKGQSLFGLCPFHGEKTPSFSVSVPKQMFYCFGCGAGGTAINFIMRAENLDFPGAIGFLADLYGMALPEDGDDGAARRRDRLCALNKDAARFYYEYLISGAGEYAREYLADRGLHKKTAVKFGLGLSPDAWEGLLGAMTAKGYGKSDLLDAGLAVKNKTGGIYDRFRGRLMFPIIDLRGRVIGFGGRIMGEGEPKYLNTSETSVFNKSRNLFALNIAKNAKSGRIILTEGYMDVITLHQAGFDSAVASLGTSLTADQARLIGRYTNEVVIAYDTDAAGRAAAARAIEVLKPSGLSIKVLSPGGAKDPDEFIRKFGREAFASLLDRSENHIEYKLLTLRAAHELSSDDGRVAYIKAAAQLLSGLTGAAETEVYAARAAGDAGISLDAMMLEVRKAAKKVTKKEHFRQRREQLSPARAAIPRDKSIKYENVTLLTIEEKILAILLDDLVWMGEIKGRITADDFTTPAMGKIYAVLEEAWLSGEKLGALSLSDKLDMSEMGLVSQITLDPPPKLNRRQVMEDCINRLIRSRAEADAAAGDIAQLAEGMKEYKAYTGKG